MNKDFITPHQIIEALEKSGVSRYRIWKDTGIEQSSLSRWLSGDRKPTPIYYKILKEYYEKRIKQDGI